MSEKTINSMRRAELIQLLKDTIPKVNAVLSQANSIDDLHDKIINQKTEIDSLYNAIFDEGGQQSQINNLLEFAEANRSDLDSARSVVLNDDGYLPEIKNAHEESLSSLRLIRKTSEKTTNIEEKLNKLSDKFDSQNQEISAAYSKILNTNDEAGESGILEQIRIAQEESDEKLSSIKNAYKEIFTDKEEDLSIKSKLDNFVSEFQEHNKKFTALNNEMFGYTETSEDGEDIEHIGKFKKIESVFDEFQKKHDELFTQIERLLSGATTTSLSKNFDDKAIEYKTEREKWEGRIFKFLIGLAITSILLAVFVIFKEIAQSLIYTVGIPIYTFSIWLMVFMGNRRAESRKLEEAFKHKFVMAKSFVGYKKSIIEMDESDQELMKNHMGNLLNAINKDSSKFFEIKGESHPVLDFFSRNKKI